MAAAAATATPPRVHVAPAAAPAFIVPGSIARAGSSSSSIPGGSAPGASALGASDDKTDDELEAEAEAHAAMHARALARARAARGSFFRTALGKKALDRMPGFLASIVQM